MGAMEEVNKMRNLRVNLERAATEQYGRKQQVCPAGETDKRRGHDTHSDRDQVKQQANFDQHVYMFPPHFNLLREELYNNWQDNIWPLVAWRMAFAAEEFVEYMNACTGLALVVDSDAVDWTCEQYLKALRRMRGLSQ